MRAAPTIVRCFDFTAKQAALFFDYVIPFFPDVQLEEQSMRLEFELSDILPPDLGRDALVELENLRADVAISVILEQMVHTFGREDLHHEVQTVIAKAINDFPRVQQRRRQRRHPVSGDFIAAAAEFSERHGLTATPVLLPSEGSPALDTGNEESVAITLTGMSLVDVNRVSWEKIVEFRRDKKATLAFRRLLRLFSDTYSHRSLDEIRDDLLSRLEGFANVARDWEFETIDSSITMILNSKVLATSAVASLASLSFGGVHEAIAASAVGAAVEIGNLSLYLRRRAYGLANLRRDHPLSYLLSARAL